MKKIDASALNQKMISQDITVINVLSSQQHDQKHIPDSINIPVDEIKEKAESALPNKDAEIVVYCASATCSASPKAASMLENMGYKNVSDFEEGLQGWEESGYDFEGSDA